MNCFAMAMTAQANMFNAEIEAQTVGANLVVFEANELESYYNNANMAQEEIMKSGKTRYFTFNGQKFTDYGMPTNMNGNTNAAKANDTQVLMNMVATAFTGSEQIQQGIVQGGVTDLKQLSSGEQSTAQFTGPALQVLELMIQLLMQS